LACIQIFLSAFYAYLYTFPQLRAIIERHSSLSQIKQKTLCYFTTLSDPIIDERYGNLRGTSSSGHRSQFDDEPTEQDER